MARPPERVPRFGPELEVVRPLGQGGMGAVHEVVSARTGARYAAKTLRPDANERARTRFRREAELLARCDRHPGVVKVHAFGTTADGAEFLLMDLVRGESLDALLEREGRLEPRRAAALARDVALALAFCHERGIVHRDVKPSNVLLDSDQEGAPRLTDFGLATAEDVDRLTRTGEFLGTIAYCAPEQLGGRDVGPAADVFSLGALLFHALAGAPPFEAHDAVSTLARLTSAEPAPSVLALEPSVPPPLAAVVARALAKAPRDRHPDARALARDLEHVLAGEPIAGAPSHHRRRALVAGAAGAGVVVLVSLAFALVVPRLEAARRATAAAESLGRARAALARARDREGVAVVSSATEAALREARLEAERARDDARGAGARAQETLRGAEAALAETSLLEAQIALATGRPERALERLGAAADREARLVRARALLALGGRGEDSRDAARAEAARLEATAALEGSPGPTALQAEAAADVLAAAGDPARAQALYASLLPRAGRRTSELTAKRGGAAFAAGDRAQAASDLQAAIPDPGAVPDARPQNARLAPLAPALYARGLGREGPGGDRDLEAAWRLADPPPDLAPDVARRWANQPTLDLEQAFIAQGEFSQSQVAELRRSMALEVRATQIAPDAVFERSMQRMGTLVVWGINQASAPVVWRMVEALKPVLSGRPTLLYLEAKATALGNPADPRLEKLVLDGLEAAPARRHRTRDLVVHELVGLGILGYSRRGEADPGTLERILRAGAEIEDVGFLIELAVAARTHERYDIADAAVRAVMRMPAATSEAFAPKVQSARLIMELRGRTAEERLEIVRAVHAEQPTDVTRDTMVVMLREANRPDELAAFLRAWPLAPRGSLELTARWLRSAGREELAQEVEKRIPKK